MARWGLLSGRRSPLPGGAGSHGHAGIRIRGPEGPGEAGALLSELLPKRDELCRVVRMAYGGLNPPLRGYLDLAPDLSEERRESIQKIRETFLPQVDKIQENLGNERAELAKLLFAEPPERSRIVAVSQQILQHQSELENEVVEHILEERELLSPSQKRKFYEIIMEQFSSGGLGVHDVKGRGGA